MKESGKTLFYLILSYQTLWINLKIARQIHNNEQNKNASRLFDRTNETNCHLPILRRKTYRLFSIDDGYYGMYYARKSLKHSNKIIENL